MNERAIFSAPYRLCLWGRVSLTAASGISLTPGAKRAKALLARIACSETGRLERSQLAAWLWPDRTDAQARANLRQLLSENGEICGAGAGILSVTRTHVGLEREICALDVDELLALSMSGGMIALAARLDQTDPRFLDDLDGVTDTLDGWLLVERERTISRLRNAVRQGCASAIESGDLAAVNAVADAWSRFDPADELTARIGLAGDAARGDAASVRRRMMALTSALKAELDVAPSNETQSVFEEALVEATRHKAPKVTRSQPINGSVRLEPGRRSDRNSWARIAVLSATLIATVALYWSYSSAAGARGGAEAASLTRTASNLIDGRTQAGYAQAESLLRRAISRDPTYASAWAELGLAVRMPAIWAAETDRTAGSRLKQESLDYIDRALSLDPRLARAMAVKGMILGVDGGAPWLSRAVTIDPNDDDAWLWYGNALLSRHDYRAALAAYAHAMALAPAAKRTVMAYAELAAVMGNETEADAAVARLAEVSTNRSDALVIRAELARVRGDLVSAARFALADLAIAPPNPYQAVETLVLVARASGDDAFIEQLLAAHPGLASLDLPAANADAAFARAVRSPDTFLDDPFAAEEARAVLAHGDAGTIARVFGPITRVYPLAASESTAWPPTIALGSAIDSALRRSGQSAQDTQLVARMGAQVRQARGEGLRGADLDLADAVVAALSSRRDEAIAAIGRAVDDGWVGQLEQWPSDPDREPAFSNLLTDPAYLRTHARFLTRVATERNGVEPVLAQQKAEMARSAQ